MFRKNPPKAEASGEIPNQINPTIDMAPVEMPTDAELVNKTLAEMTEYIEDFDISDQVGHFVPGASSYRTVLRQIAGMVELDGPDPRPETRSAVEKYLKPQLTEIYGKEIASHELDAAESTVGQIVCIRYLVNSLRTKLGFMRGDHRVQPESKYGLLKAIEQSDDNQSPSNRGTLWLMALNRTEKNEDDSFMREVQTELERGELDEFVAIDVFRDALDPRQKSQQKRELASAARFFRFVNSLVEEDLPEGSLPAKLFDPEVMVNWPKEVQNLVERRRKEMHTVSEERINEYAERLRVKGLVLLPKDERNLEGNVKAYCKELDKFLKAQPLFSKILKRKNMPLQETEPENNGVETKTTPEMELPDNSIMTYSEGDTITINEEQLVKKAGDDGFDIKDINFANDVRSIFEYLKRIDKADASDSGLKKLVRASNGEDNGRDLWEFKPSEAVGLPTNTKITKRVRVIVSMCEEGFIVHGFVRRDSLDKGVKAIVDGLRSHK